MYKRQNQYRFIRPDNFFGVGCEYRISANIISGEWSIVGFCDDNFGQTTFATAPANGASSEPPLAGWTNGFILTECD